MKRLLLTAVCGSQQHSVSILSSVTSSYHFEISQSECSVTDIGTDHRSGIFLPGEILHTILALQQKTEDREILNSLTEILN